MLTTVTDFESSAAKSLAAVYASVHAYADGISTLALAPCTLDRKFTPLPDHYHATLLRDGLDEELTNQQAMAYWLESLMLRGNAYGQIRRNGGGRPARISPLEPDNVVPCRIDGRIHYAIRGSSLLQPLPASDMIHVHMNYKMQTLRGIGPVAFARTTIAGGMSQESFALQFFTQGAQPRVMLEHPATLSDEQAKEILERFNTSHAGGANAHKTGILSGGTKLHILTMAPEEAQFLESRQFTVNEVARWFNLPASRIGGNRASGTYANLEQDQLAFVAHSIRPVCKMFEGEFNRKLLSRGERAEVQIRFDLSEMTEGLMI